MTGDYSIFVVRGEKTVITLTAVDRGKISDDVNKKATQYLVEMDLKVESEKLAKRRQRIERRRFGIKIESGLLIESFQLVSNNINTRQQHSTIIPIGGRAHWWFHRNFGVEGYWLYSNYSASNGFGQNTDVNMSWFGGDIKMRYQFRRSIHSPTIELMLGYNVLSTNVDRANNPIVRLDDRYQYLDVGVAGKLPLHSLFGLKAKALFFPFVHLGESPFRSGGDGNTKGFQLQGGVYYNFWNNFTLEVEYMFLFLDNDFTGTATRPDTTGTPLSLVQTRVVYQGGIVGLKYEF